MSGFLARVWASTIWAPDAIPPQEGEYAATIKRGLLPLFDVIMIVSALLAIRGGLPTFVIVYDETVSQLASWALLTCACLCLVGVAFPRLWLLEALAKTGLLSLLIVYAVVLIGWSAVDPPRGFVGGVVLAACLPPVFRIVWLGREYRRRRGA